MDYKTLFLDIDGTILKPDHTYSNSTKDAINQVQKKGIDVFLATGRPLHEIKELAQELNVDSLIGYNGAYAVLHNETIVNEPMTKDTINHFIKVCHENGHEMVLYTSDNNYFTSLNGSFSKQFIAIFGLRDNKIYNDKVSEQILSVTLMNVSPEETELYKLNEDIHLSQVNIEGLEHSYDIIQKSVNKGKAIQHILALTNVQKQQAIAFGDGMNDKEMLTAVSEGFAMGNANPDLFAFAKHKTTSAAEDGIFNGLKQLGLVE